MATNPKIFDGGLKEGAKCWMGIDQSLTGFAVTFIDKDDKYMTYVYKAEDTGIKRLFNIETWLCDLLKKYKIIDIALESPVKMSHAAIISGELYATVRLALYKNCKEPGRAPLQVAPPVLKKYVTGKGTGVQKNQMLLQVYKKWDVEFNDDNAADSYGLARIVRGNYDHKYEEDIINSLKDPKFRDIV